MELAVKIDIGGDADAAEIEENTIDLIRQLRDLDVERVSQRPGAEAPEGAKGGAAELGALLVALYDPAVIGSVIRLLRGWLSRNDKRRATVVFGDDRIELSGLSPGQIDRLIDDWIAVGASRGDG